MAKVYKHISGYCPYTEENERIEVAFSELHFLGDMSPHYKKLGFDCPYSDECTIVDQRGMNCPIYDSAIDG